MLNKADRIVLIIKKRLSGTITRAEQLELKNWMDASAENQQIFDQLCSDQPVEDYMKTFMSMDEGAGWEKIASGIRPGGRLRKIPSWLYAAVIVAFVTILTLTYIQNDTNPFGKNRQHDLMAGNGLQFMKEDVSTVFGKIGAKYNIKIEIPDTVDKDMVMTGKMMETDDIQAVVSVLECLYHDLHIEYDGSKIIVKRS